LDKCPRCGTMNEPDGMCVPSRVDQYFCKRCGYTWDKKWSTYEYIGPKQVSRVEVSCVERDVKVTGEKK